MPTDERVLGFSNRWYEPAIASASSMEVAGLRIRLITPVYFLATKLEAFRSRGKNDYSGSHDLEDVVAMIDGRPEVVDEVRNASWDVRAYIASQVRQLLATPAFTDAVSGFLLPDPASQARHDLLVRRLNALTLQPISRPPGASC